MHFRYDSPEEHNNNIENLKKLLTPFGVKSPAGIKLRQKYPENLIKHHK